VLFGGCHQPCLDCLLSDQRCGYRQQSQLLRYGRSRCSSDFVPCTFGSADGLILFSERQDGEPDGARAAHICKQNGRQPHVWYLSTDRRTRRADAGSSSTDALRISKRSSQCQTSQTVYLSDPEVVDTRTIVERVNNPMVFPLWLRRSDLDPIAGKGS